MSLAQLILMVHTMMTPSWAPPPEPPPFIGMFDLKVREWRAKGAPTSYQLTLTIRFP